MNDAPIKEEEGNLRRLRWIVDLTHATLMQSDLTLHESLALMNNTRKAVLYLFPDKEFVYDLISLLSKINSFQDVTPCNTSCFG